MSETSRVTLEVAGRVFGPWTELEIVRDLTEISGSFSLSFHDEVRADRALRAGLRRWRAQAPALVQLTPGQKARVKIDGQLVLVGWIDDVDLDWAADRLGAVVRGRDVTGDLVDCAATVDGPAEFRRITLRELCARICAPFGIGVKSDIGEGRTFERFSIDVAETAMGAMEKATRQAAVLLTSDGIGNLVLTKSGTGRAPEPLRIPGNIHDARVKYSWRQRFSHYVYKAQATAGGGTPALDHQAAPLAGALNPAPAAPGAAAAQVVRTGRAQDREVTRWRPRVRLVRTESAGASAQEQADWLMRVARGQSEGLTYVVPDFRGGAGSIVRNPSDPRGGGKLWRPNELVAVVDPYAGINRDMLIAAVTWRYDAQGSRTEIRVVGPEAFDRIQEDARRQRRERSVEDNVRRDSVARPLGGLPQPERRGDR